MRRRLGWTVEVLADKSSLRPNDIVRLEEHLPGGVEPRIVSRLAKVFDVNLPSMMQLSGLAVPREEIQNGAIRFAARSESLQALTDEERGALEEFVRILGRDPDKAHR